MEEIFTKNCGIFVYSVLFTLKPVMPRCKRPQNDKRPLETENTGIHLCKQASRQFFSEVNRAKRTRRGRP